MEMRTGACTIFHARYRNIGTLGLCFSMYRMLSFPYRYLSHVGVDTATGGKGEGGNGRRMYRHAFKGGQAELG